MLGPSAKDKMMRQINKKQPNRVVIDMKDTFMALSNKGIIAKINICKCLVGALESVMSGFLFLHR